MFSFLEYLIESDTSRASSRERDLHHHLQKHGLVDAGAKPAGFSGGQDVVLTHPKTGKKVAGTQRKYVGGEVKDSVKGAKFGSVAIRYHKDKGWHIPDSTREAKPKLSAAIDKATVTHTDGKKRSLLHHLNHVWGPSKVGKKLPGVTSDTTDMSPAHSYMQDHDVHFVHIGDRGTFKAGHSSEKDHHNTGLPTLTGTGRFTVSTERKRTPEQEKAGTGMQVNFRVHPKSVPHSNVDISTDNGAKTLKKNLMSKK